MIKVGITGQPGFIGSHLFNYLNLQKNIKTIPFKDEYFQDKKSLTDFTKKCDCIVHLAALNRHNDQQEIYSVNINLVKILIDVFETNNLKPHIIMSSSTQEERGNIYGKSKKAGRELFARWAKNNNAAFTGLIIPNVFGPFGKPFYNSVVSTFAYQITHEKTPKIEIDAHLELLYINNLIKMIYNHINNKTNQYALKTGHDFKLKVSEILKKLHVFHQTYYEEKHFPKLDNLSDVSLFNTYRSYIDNSFFPVKLDIHKDDRGIFSELIKAHSQGQTSFSATKAGIMRGNHFHIRKIERFAVIKGEAEIRLRRIGTEKEITYRLTGDEPSFVDMPVWYTHNITNVGKEDLLTIFWINEFFDADDPDTFFEEV